MTLEELEKAAPAPALDPPPAPDPGRVEEDARKKALEQRREDIRKAGAMKSHILAMIHRGDAPQDILYTAVDCIGLYSGDGTFSSAARDALTRFFGDGILQQSLFLDAAAEQAAALNTAQAAAIRKIRAYAQRQAESLRNLAGDLERLDNTLAQATTNRVTAAQLAGIETPPPQPQPPQ